MFEKHYAYGNIEIFQEEKNAVSPTGCTGEQRAESLHDLPEPSIQLVEFIGRWLDEILKKYPNCDVRDWYSVGDFYVEVKKEEPEGIKRLIFKHAISIDAIVIPIPM